MVECQLPKLEVAGSSPVARSNFLSNFEFLFASLNVPPLTPRVGPRVESRAPNKRPLPQNRNHLFANSPL